MNPDWVRRSPKVAWATGIAFVVAGAAMIGTLSTASAVSPPVVPGTAYGVDPAHATMIGGSKAHPCAPTALYTCLSGWKTNGTLGHSNPPKNAVQWNAVMAPADGTYPITFYYWNGDPNGDTTCGGEPNHPPQGCRPAQFVIDGVELPTIYQMPCTPKLNDWVTELSTTLMLPLKAGSNTIKIWSTGADVVDLDEIIVNTGQTSTPSPSPTTTPCTTAPDAPSGLATSGGPPQIPLGTGALYATWNAPNSCAPVDAYAVYLYCAPVAVAPGLPDPPAITQMTETSTNVYNSGPLGPPGHFCTVTVTAHDAVGWSAWSAWAAYAETSQV